MGAEYSPDIVWKAQELYVIERQSFAKVAQLTGVTSTTLKNWSKKFGWRQKREEIAKIEAENKMDLYRSRKKAIQMLLESENGKECSQMAFAVTSLENLVLKQQEVQLERQLHAKQENTAKIKPGNKEEALKQLAFAVQGRLLYVLENPQAINSKNIQDILNMLKLMEQVDIPQKEETKPNQGMSKELAENIKKALNLTD